MELTSSGEGGQVIVDRRFRERRIAVQRDEGRRRLRGLLVIAAIALVAVAALGAIESPLLDVDRISVSGGVQTTPEAIIAASGIGTGDPTALVDTGAAAAAIEALPWVRTAEVSSSLPGTVTIEITERTPAALIHTASATLVVDDTGRVLRTEALGSAVAAADGPAFVAVHAPDGSVADAVAPGDAVAGDLLAAIDLAARLRTNPAGAVAAVHVTPVLSIDLRDGGSVVFGDRTDLDTKIENFRTMFARVDLSCLAVVDLTVASRPVLTREDACS